MGWLHMTSMRGHSGPRQYLDAQLTFETPEGSSRVLRSALVRMRVYYAAVEVLSHGRPRQVSAVVCLVRYNPRDREGYIFGYKDMDESMGPCEADCPEAILALLTPTEQPHAVAWRERCRANAERRRALSAKPRPGQTIVFADPISFADGRRLDRFQVVENPRSHRTVLLRDPVRGTLYRVPNLRTRTYALSEPPKS